MTGLDTNNGVGMGVKPGITSKDLGRDRVSLDAVGTTCNRFLDDIGQELAVSISRFEILALYDATELRTDLTFVGRLSRTWLYTFVGLNRRQAVSPFHS